MLYEKSHNLALNLAKSEGYIGVEYLGEWQDYDLFVVNSDAITGYPEYILVDFEAARWATPAETESILFA